ncbi:MAG: hypothetical protein J6R22_03375 [Alphaproteobacteria bacterium]|nr:hypothetical protein [Alphaproteobacteria bacterium]
MALQYWDYNYAQTVYQALLYAGCTDNGAAGIMGNLYAESNICPFRQQNDYSTGYTYSLQLTETFRANDKNYFVYYDGDTGYSLAQWTDYDRRSNYWDFCGQQGIGDGTLSLQFLIHEMQTGFASCWAVCTDPNKSLLECSNKILLDFERPEQHGPDVQATRYSYSSQVYNDFSGLPPAPPYMGVPIWLLFKLKDKNFGFI